MTERLDAGYLAQFVAKHDIEADVVHLEVDTPTVAAAAQALGVQPEQIIKSVLFMADKNPVMVIASGLTRIDRKALADHLGIARRRVKIASADKVLTQTGYVAGSVPPFGYKQPISTVVETAVLRQSNIYGGGGDIHALMWLTPSELQKVVGYEVADLSEQDAPTPSPSSS